MELQLDVTFPKSFMVKLFRLVTQEKCRRAHQMTDNPNIHQQMKRNSYFIKHFISGRCKIMSCSIGQIIQKKCIFYAKKLNRLQTDGVRARVLLLLHGGKYSVTTEDKTTSKSL